MLATFTISLSAQQDTSEINKDSLALKYKTETIYMQLSTYTKNNQKYDIGMTGGGMKNEMMLSPDAMPYFKKYQKQKIWTLVCTGIQVVMEVAAFTTHDKSRRTALHIGGGVVSLVTIPLYFGSYKNLNKAVWIRNGDVLSNNR